MDNIKFHVAQVICLHPFIKVKVTVQGHVHDLLICDLPFNNAWTASDILEYY